MMEVMAAARAAVKLGSEVMAAVAALRVSENKGCCGCCACCTRGANCAAAAAPMSW